MKRTFGLPQSTPEAGKSGCRLKGGVGEVWTAAMGQEQKKRRHFGYPECLRREYENRRG